MVVVMVMVVLAASRHPPMQFINRTRALVVACSDSGYHHLINTDLPPACPPRWWLMHPPSWPDYRAACFRFPKLPRPRDGWIFSSIHFDFLCFVLIKFSRYDGGLFGVFFLSLLFLFWGVVSQNDVTIEWRHFEHFGYFTRNADAED